MIKMNYRVGPSHNIKVYRGKRGKAPLILNPTVDGGDLQISHSVRFTPGARTTLPSEQEAGWAPRAVWTVWKKVLAAEGIRIPDLVGTPTTLSRILMFADRASQYTLSN